MGRPAEINLCSRIGCHVIYSRGSRRSLTLLRGLLCVRKSRAIRNGHEGPPRRSLFELSSECWPIEQQLCFASTILPRSAGRCLRKTESPYLNGEVRDLRLNVVPIDCNLLFDNRKRLRYLDVHTVLTFILYTAILTFILFYCIFIICIIIIIGPIYTETSLFFTARPVTGNFEMMGTVFIFLSLRFMSL